VLMGVFAVMAIFSSLRSYLFAYVGESVVADLRMKLYNNLTGLSLAFFGDQQVGVLTSRLTSDVAVVQSLITSTLSELLRQGLTMLGTVAIVALTNPRLTLAMLAVVPLMMGSVMIYGEYLRRISTRVQDALADAGGVLHESLSAIHIVQSFVREDYERQRYRREIQAALRLAMQRALAVGSFNGFFIMVVLGGMGTVVWYGARMVISGQLTAGSLSAFVLYVVVLAFSIGNFTELYGSMQTALGASRRIFELLDLQPEISDSGNPPALGKLRGHVQLDRVTFSYGDNGRAPVLDGISIEARPGEIVALVGPSGAGKSTLVTLIPRFYDVAAGAILVDSHDVRTLKLSDLRQAIGVVPQETVLFSGSLRDNIAYGKLDATDAEIEAAAKAAHAHEFILQCPDGYRSLVGERGAKLSGGQRQRIAIARALLKDPAILILDEATSALDSESEHLVQEALDVLMQGRTTFVIAHRLSTVRRAHKIVVLSHGRIVQQGAHEELLAQGGMYKQLYDLQFRAASAQGGTLT
jgi:ATP-binding cassette, subfamily B, bacterial MsbA